MAVKRFRFFATKEDLSNIFSAFQYSINVHYYKWGCMSELNEIVDITKTDLFGFNTSGSHINDQWLICPIDIVPQKRTNEALCDRNDFYIDQMINSKSIVVNIGGIYENYALFPTEISTLYYDDSISKQLYDTLKKYVEGMQKLIKDIWLQKMHI